MAKKKVEETLNLDSILFKCRDILRKARNSGSFFEKRDMMLTLVFLRFIGEKFDDGIEALRQKLIEMVLILMMIKFGLPFLMMLHSPTAPIICPLRLAGQRLSTQSLQS